MSRGRYLSRRHLYPSTPHDEYISPKNVKLINIKKKQKKTPETERNLIQTLWFTPESQQTRSFMKVIEENKRYVLVTSFSPPVQHRNLLTSVFPSSRGFQTICTSAVINRLCSAFYMCNSVVQFFSCGSVPHLLTICSVRLIILIKCQDRCGTAHCGLGVGSSPPTIHQTKENNSDFVSTES